MKLLVTEMAMTLKNHRHFCYCQSSVCDAQGYYSSTAQSAIVPVSDEKLIPMR